MISNNKVIVTIGKKNYFQFHFVEYFVIEARNYGIFNFKILEFSIGAK